MKVRVQQLQEYLAHPLLDDVVLNPLGVVHAHLVEELERAADALGLQVLGAVAPVTRECWFDCYVIVLHEVYLVEYGCVR